MRYFLDVLIENARDLMSADVSGFSDPYCVAYIRDYEGHIVNPRHHHQQHQQQQVPPLSSVFSSITTTTNTTTNTTHHLSPSEQNDIYNSYNSSLANIIPIGRERRKSFDNVKQAFAKIVRNQNYSDNRGKNGKRQTHVVMRNLNPVWNESMVLETSAHPTSDTLVIEVWDYDKVTNDDFLGAVAIPLSQLKQLGKRRVYKEKLNGSGVKSGYLNFELRPQNFPEPHWKKMKKSNNNNNNSSSNDDDNEDDNDNDSSSTNNKEVMLCIDHPFHFRLNESLSESENRVFPDLSTALLYAKQHYAPDVFVHFVAIRVDPLDIETRVDLKKEICNVEAYSKPIITSKDRVVFDRSNMALYGPLELGCKQEFHVVGGAVNVQFHNITFSAVGSSHSTTQLIFHPESQVYMHKCHVKGTISMHNCTSFLENCTIDNGNNDNKNKKSTTTTSKNSNSAVITIGEVSENEPRDEYLKNQISPVIRNCKIIGTSNTSSQDNVGILMARFTFVEPAKNPNLVQSSTYTQVFHESDFGTSMANRFSERKDMFKGNSFSNCSTSIKVVDVENLNDDDLAELLN